jgi:hypothetical protein
VVEKIEVKGRYREEDEGVMTKGDRGGVGGEIE